MMKTISRDSTPQVWSNEGHYNTDDTKEDHSRNFWIEFHVKLDQRPQLIKEMHMPRLRNANWHRLQRLHFHWLSGAASIDETRHREV
jgi:hypothetical protein